MHDATIGERAVRKGYLTSDQLHACLRDKPPGTPLGAYLMQCGLLTADQLSELERASFFLCPICYRRFEISGASSASVYRCPRCTGTLVPQGGDEKIDAASVEHRVDSLPEEVQRAADNPENLFHKYVRIQLLGRGGVGAVWKCYDRELRRTVAVKFLEGAGEATVQRFLREARLAGRLEHPNIARVYESGSWQGQHYIVMQYVAGRELLDRPLSIREGAEVMIKAARAIQYAHENGVIHRDIKPGNIMLGDKGEVTVLDFGLAKEPEGGAKLSVSGTIMGTPEYMSPEQARGDLKNVDARSDVYSLGATLYEIATRRVPFKSEEFFDLIQKIQTDEPAPPVKIDSSIPWEINTIILKALEKDPSRRYATASEFADDLQRFLDGEPIRARPTSLTYRAARGVRRHRRLLYAAGIAAAVTIGVVFVTIIRPSLEEERRDREKLDAALQEKRSMEEAFRTHLAKGEFDAAIELAEPRFGTLAALPSLRVPARVEVPEYRDLRRPFDFDLAQAYWRRGRDRTDLVQAYRFAVAAGQESVGREALMKLGSDLEAQGRHGSALEIYRLCEARWGGTPDLTRRLAQGFERAGQLEAAAARWRKLGAVPPLLESLLPRKSFSTAFPGAFFAGDVDADGKSEILHVSIEHVLTVYGIEKNALVARASVTLPPPEHNYRVEVLDADGDGKPEILASTGKADLRKGRLIIISWNDGKPAIAVHDDGFASTVFDVEAANLDAENGPELLVATGPFERSVRIYRYREQKLRQLGMFQVGSDPEFVHVRDQGKQVLVHTGPWSTTNGYRIVSFSKGEDGRWRGVPDGKERFHGPFVVWTDPDRGILTTYRPTYETVAMKDLIEPAVYQIEIVDGKVAPLKRLDGPLLEDYSCPVAVPRFRGGRWSVVHLNGALRFVSLAGGDVSVIPSLLGNPLGADVDGDGDDELITWASDAVRIWGLGSSSDAVDTVPPVRLKSVGEEMLDAHLHQEAQSILEKQLSQNPDDLRVRFSLGQALSGQGRHAEAAREFERAAQDPALAVEALLRRAYALENARDWAALDENVRRLESIPGLDAFAAEIVRRWKSWSGAAASIKPRVSVRDFATLIAETAWDAQVGAKGLEAWDTSGMPGSVGIPVFYDGGALRLRFRLRMKDPEWESGIRLGIYPASSLCTPGRGQSAGPMFVLYFGGEGATDRPMRCVRWIRADRSGQAESTRLAHGGSIVTGEEEFVVEMEYIPGLDRAFVSIVGGRKLFEPFSCPVPFRFDRGIYQVGAIRETTRTLRSLGHSAWAAISEIQVEGSSEIRVHWPEPATIRELLLTGNGEAARGRWESAERRYTQAINRGDKEIDAYCTWRAHVYRAWVRQKAGRQEEARADIQAALRIPGEEVAQAIRSASPLMTALEREWMLSALREW